MYACVCVCADFYVCVYENENLLLQKERLQYVHTFDCGSTYVVSFIPIASRC